jgi:FkbM family methyltransferase
MHAPKKLFNKVINAVSSILMNDRIELGDITCVRRYSLPNLLSKTVHYEEFLDDIYRTALAQRDGAVIDVGVNTGQTLFKVLSIDKDRSYFGFEPLTMAASSVEGFLIDNKIRNCCILPIALSDKNGSIPINIRGEGIYSMASTVSSIVDGFRPKSFYDYVKYIYAARGDEVVDSLGITSIAFIKIDVEGAELEVLKGLQATIPKFRPYILFEVLHHYLVVTEEKLDEETINFRESRIKELEEIIRSNSFNIYQINGAQEIIKIDKIKPKMVNDLASTDFIAVPEENEKDFCEQLEIGGRKITS